MADADSRYNLSITLKITDVSTGEVVPEFSETILNQYNLKYEDMNEIQWQSIEALCAAFKPFGQAVSEEIKAKRQASGKEPVQIYK